MTEQLSDQQASMRNGSLSEAAEGGDIEYMYMTFDLANETYAVNIQYVTEIVGMQHISAVPDMPEFIRGAMNLRGKVIPVMDLRLRFGLPWQEYNDRTTIIVLDQNNTQTGMVVDRVTDVVTIPQEFIDPPPKWQKSENRGVVLGLAKQNNSVSMILDVSRLLPEDQSIEIAPINPLDPH